MTLRDDGKQIRVLLDGVLVPLSKFLDRVDHLLSVADGSDAREASAGVVSPPAPEPPRPVGVPQPPAVTSPWPWVERVRVTTFGTKADEATKDWQGLSYPWFTPSPGSGMVDAFGAAPWRVNKGDGFDVRLADGRIVFIPIGDGGPWNDAARPDAYLPAGRRPQAETGTDLRGRPTNYAGFDVTPAAMSMLNGKTARENWETDTDLVADLRWHPADQPHVVTDHEMWAASPAIRRAALALVGKPFPYAPGTEDGELGCADVVSMALINAGVIEPAELQLAVSALIEELRTKHGWKTVTEPWQDGDVIEWGPRPGQTHGHVGILIVDGDVVTCVNNSSSQKAVIQMPLAGYDRPVVAVVRSPKG